MLNKIVEILSEYTTFLCHPTLSIKLLQEKVMNFIIVDIIVDKKNYLEYA